jgi:hypothetical protein
VIWGIAMCNFESIYGVKCIKYLSITLAKQQRYYTRYVSLLCGGSCTVVRLIVSKFLLMLSNGNENIYETVLS